MPKVLLLLDFVKPDSRTRWIAQREVELPGVPAVGDSIGLTPSGTLALKVEGVRWSAIDGSVSLFLGPGGEERPGLPLHDGELALPGHRHTELEQAGWIVGQT